MPPIDFRSAVLERSHVVPVVVDFWAPWCAPCRTLGPIIEQLAEQAEGRWELVKLDTDEQPEVAQALDIRGIPAVKMFHRGKVVAEFVGALPGHEIRSWLDANLPDPRLDRLEAIVAGWTDRGGEIAPELEKFVAENPDVPAARLRLAQAIVARDPDRARELIRSTEGGAGDFELALDVAALADLMQAGGETPDRIAPHLEGARTALLAHDLDATLDHLVEIAMIDKRFGDELARRAAVALFRLIGRDHELTREHERRLAMALHS